MNKLIVLLLLASMVLALTGCETTSGRTGGFGNNTANGAALGALGGAGVGALIGGKKAAWTGAAVGAVGGGLMGNQYDQNKAQVQGAYQQGRMDGGAGYPPPPQGPPSYGGSPSPRSY